MAILLLQLAFAVATLSLTLISEVLRAGLLLIMDFYLLLVLRSLHRGKLGRFRFGIGRLEQICNLAVGLAVISGGFWVGNRVIETLLGDAEAATPLGLALAAVVSAVNTLVNFIGWLAVRTAMSRDGSAIYKAQADSRLVSLIASLIVQITLTGAVLAKDPVISIWLDGLGATFVACFMIVIGLRITGEAIPHLLDHAAPQEVKQGLLRALEDADVPPESLLRIRSRRAGDRPQVELTLSSQGTKSLKALRARADRFQRALEARGLAIEHSVVFDGLFEKSP